MGDQQEEEDINNLVGNFAELGVEEETKTAATKPIPSNNPDIRKLADWISSGKVSNILVLSGAGVRAPLKLKSHMLTFDLMTYEWLSASSFRSQSLPVSLIFGRFGFFFFHIVIYIATHLNLQSSYL